MDSSAGTPLPDRFFFTVQDALDDCCEDTIVVGTENYYAENLVFKDCNQRIYGFDSPIIVGRHQLTDDIDKFETRGVQWLHSGDIDQPLFALTTSMENITIQNCLLDGKGVRNAASLATIANT